MLKSLQVRLASGGGLAVRCRAGLRVLLRPLLPWALTMAGVQNVPPLPSLDDVLFELLFGLLGLGGLRTIKRRQRVSVIAPK